MLAKKRERIILDYLEENDFASTKDLAQLTHTSLSTIRRDLNRMEDGLLLTKIHGGAEKKKNTTNNLINEDQNIDIHYFDKLEIASIAAQFIEDNNIIFIGSGKTCTLLSDFIKDRRNLSIVTTNIDLAVSLANHSNIAILLLGGTVHTGPNYIETLSDNNFDELHTLHFDKTFITVNGVDLDWGYSIISRKQISLYNLLFLNTKYFYLLANKDKFGRKSFTHLFDINKISNVILNKNTEQKYIDYYNSSNINIYTK